MTGFEMALAIVKEFESLRLRPYRFPGESQLTIGYGHAVPPTMTDLTITEQQADQLLQVDLNSRDADLRYQLGPVFAALTPGQLAATLSFKFNCIPALFDSSTFLDLLKQGRFMAAQQEFPRWVYGYGHVLLPGLVRRRKCEAFIFGGGTIEELIEKNWFLETAA